MSPTNLSVVKCSSAVGGHCSPLLSSLTQSTLVFCVPTCEGLSRG